QTCKHYQAPQPLFIAGLLNRSWPGLARPSTRSHELIVEVIPIRIVEQNEADFPSSPIMLQVLLALPGIPDVVVALEIYQALQPIPLGEAVNDALPVFPNPPDEVVCNADVKDAVRLVGQEVN